MDGDMIFQRQALCGVLPYQTDSLGELSPRSAFCSSPNHSRPSGRPLQFCSVHGMVNKGCLCNSAGKFSVQAWNAEICLSQ